MTDKVQQAKATIVDKKKVSEEDQQQWLEAVHFGSCCSDPLLSNDDQKENDDCSINKKSGINQK